MTISNLSIFEVEVDVDETEINKIELGQKSDIEVDAFPDTTFSGEVVEIGKYGHPLQRRNPGISRPTLKSK